MAYKILIVEDDDQVRASLREALASNGYQVEEERDGREVMHRYRSESPDVVITDLVMPHKDGLEIIKELKEEFPDSKIIAISGGVPEFDNTTRILLPLAKEMGALFHLKKPYAAEELLETVREALGKR